MAVPSRLEAPGEASPQPSRRQRLRALFVRLRALLRPPRQIRPTREGYGFMLLTLGVGFAALNTGNNLLYLVLGMMLSLIGVSGVLSELSVARVTVSRRFSPEITVGQESPVALTLRCRKRWLPAIGIWIEEGYQRHVDADPAYFVYVPAGGEATVKVGYRFHRRGKQPLHSVEIATTYPFGLFRRSYYAPLEDEVLVYPRVETVVPHRRGFEDAHGDVPVSRKGGGEEFLGLRQYAPGDDPRFIHWKTSARRTRLLVRENAAQQRRRVVIRLEIINPLPEDSAYEMALVRVVSYAAYYLERGYLVAIDIPGTAVPFDAGLSHLRRVLRSVALTPTAGEAAEQPPSNVRWPAGGQVIVRIAGQVVTVEETG